jgi:hypothetical protein
VSTGRIPGDRASDKFERCSKMAAASVSISLYQAVTGERIEDGDRRG